MKNTERGARISHPSFLSKKGKIKRILIKSALLPRLCHLFVYFIYGIIKYCVKTKYGNIRRFLE